MVPADPAGMAFADGQGQAGPVARNTSQRGVLSTARRNWRAALPGSGQPVLDRCGGLAGQQPGRSVVAVNGRLEGRPGRSARTLASMTSASSAAQAIPCGTPAMPPTTLARLCTA